MRKDVRLGLTVGVVLFAVVIVYFFVASGNKQRKDIVYNGDPAAARKDEPKTPDIDAMAAKVADPGPTTAPAERRNDSTATGGNETGGWNWGDALANGRDVVADVTRTPSIGANVADTRLADARTDTPAIERTPTIDRTPTVDRTPTIERATDTQTPSPATRPAGQRVHVVKENENFWTIARTEYGNGAYFAHLQRANPKLDPKGLRPGMKVIVPDVSEFAPATPGGGVAPVAVVPTTRPAPRVIDAAKEYVVRNGDTLYSISIKLWGKPDRYSKLYELNRQIIGNDPNRLVLGTVLTLPEPPTATTGQLH